MANTQSDKVRMARMRDRTSAEMGESILAIRREHAHKVRTARDQERRHVLEKAALKVNDTVTDGVIRGKVVKISHDGRNVQVRVEKTKRIKYYSPIALTKV